MGGAPDGVKEKKKSTRDFDREARNKTDDSKYPDITSRKIHLEGIRIVTESLDWIYQKG
jgi:hypothetical protein